MEIGEPVAVAVVAVAASSKCAPGHLKLKTETVATSPSDRARTRIGVGEEVLLEVTGQTGAVKWSSNKSSKLSPKTGTSVTLTAHERAESVTVEAVDSCGCKVTVTFTVVEPSSWTMKRKSGGTLRHSAGRPDCGWKGTFFIHPDDVNFYNVKFREKDSQYTGTGSYSGYNGDWHGNYPLPDRVSPWLSLTSHTSADGSKAAGEDQVYTGDPGAGVTGSAPPFTAGAGHFPITMQWRVAPGAEVDFADTRQEDEIFSTGKCESRKGGNTESTMYSDPASSW